MRVIFRLYRTAKIRTDQLKGLVGFELSAPNDKTAVALKEKYGPHFAYGFRIFWQDSAPEFRTTVVGIEAMAFDVGAPGGTPVAGLVTCDPISSEQIHRLDGALHSEIQRLGLPTSSGDEYEWRGWYEIKP